MLLNTFINENEMWLNRRSKFYKNWFNIDFLFLLNFHFPINFCFEVEYPVTSVCYDDAFTKPRLFFEIVNQSKKKELPCETKAYPIMLKWHITVLLNPSKANSGHTTNEINCCLTVSAWRICTLPFPVNSYDVRIKWVKILLK